MNSSRSLLHPQEIALDKFEDERGLLSFLELPFDAKRFYMLSQLDDESTRGHHAHKNLTQFIFSAKGSFKVELFTPVSSFVFELFPASNGLLIPPGYWRILSNFANNAVCVVLASSAYDEADYIREYAQYEEWFEGVYLSEG